MTENVDLRPSRLLSVSSAARLVGASPSSLRAWASAGEIPHLRTRGGHRGFEVEELTAWLAARGGRLPPAAERPPERVPSRIPAEPKLAALVRASGAQIMREFERRMSFDPTARRRLTAGKKGRAHDSLECLADGLEAGDLGDCFRDAEWEGFRAGAGGQPGENVIVSALALRAAVGRVVHDQSDIGPAAQRSLDRVLDRLVVRVAAGYADGITRRALPADR